MSNSLRICMVLGDAVSKLKKKKYLVLFQLNSTKLGQMPNLTATSCLQKSRIKLRLGGRQSKKNR